jgi:hypothetical protein
LVNAVLTYSTLRDAVDSSSALLEEYCVLFKNLKSRLYLPFLDVLSSAVVRASHRQVEAGGGLAKVSYEPV